MASDGSKPKANPIVGKIVKDPKSPPNALCLRGFVGDSSEDKSIRLYFDPNFSDYVDVPEAAILHSEPVPEAWSPFGAMYLWIERDAELMHGSERIKANFMQGRIFQQQAGMQQQAAAAPQPQRAPQAPFGGQAGFQITPPPITPVVPCPTQPMQGCPPSPFGPCITPPAQFCPPPTLPDNCRTPIFPCLPPPPPTPFFPCPTNPNIDCPPSPPVLCQTNAGPFCPPPFGQGQFAQPFAAQPQAAPIAGGPGGFQFPPRTHPPMCPQTFQLSDCPTAPNTACCNPRTAFSDCITQAPIFCPPTPLRNCPPTPPQFCVTPPPQLCPPTPPVFCQPFPPGNAPAAQQQIGVGQQRPSPFFPCATGNGQVCPTENGSFCEMMTQIPVFCMTPICTPACTPPVGPVAEQPFIPQVQADPRMAQFVQAGGAGFGQQAPVTFGNCPHSPPLFHCTPNTLTFPCRTLSEPECFVTRHLGCTFFPPC
ncbi:MAG: hypothetical protein ACR2RA_04625 [Geminicoccaceae bacterium]